MPLFITAYYQIEPEGIEAVKKAIEEFTKYVKANEPGTKMYVAWQEKNDPTKFMHFFIFEDEKAQEIHSKSEAVKKFEAVYSPFLANGPVVFTDYDTIASKI